MKRHKLLAVLLLLVVIFTLAGPAGPAQGRIASPPEGATGPMNVLVTFYQAPGPAQVSLIESLGGTVKTVYHVVPVIAATMPAQNINALKNDPSVEFVEVDDVVPNSLASQTLPWGVDRIDAELVHPTYKGTGVKVAVLDTGIDLDHPDLNVAGNVTFVAGTSSGDDDNGHGTAVAGIIAALDNDIGVVGVAPEVALYAVKVIDINGYAIMSVVLSGIQWAIDNNMQVINMSFGYPGVMPDSIIDALTAAYNAGIVIVAGAGNGGNAQGTGNNVWSPARYKSVIAVGATDNLDQRLTNSSTGYQLELVAPGNNIYTTAMGGGYGYISGTSASSPHAAGTAALLINSGLTNNVELRSRLRKSATDLGASGWDPLFGAGLINAYNAVNFSEPTDLTPPVTTIALSGTAGNLGWYLSNVTATLSATDSGSGVAYTKYSLDGGSSWLTYSSPLTLSTDGANLVLARSWDNAGNGEGPPDFATAMIDKTPPVLTEITSPTSIQRIRKGEMFNINYTGTIQDATSGVDTQNTTLTDEYGVYNRNLGWALYGTTSVEAWANGNDPSGGRTYTFRLTGSDMAGNSTYVEAITTVTVH